MFPSPELSGLSPAVLVHLFTALGALVLGPIALGLRKGSLGHCGAGHAWITLMAVAAMSSIFIRDFRLPNLWGYTAIHTLTLLSFVGIGLGLLHIARRRVQRHKRAMQITYGAALLAGAFALLPDRYLGSLVWHHALGWV